MNSDKELKVMWNFTWEPEGTKNKWPTLQWHILEFEARKASLCPQLIKLWATSSDKALLQKLQLRTGITVQTWFQAAPPKNFFVFAFPH